jgi:hypothetical protein
MSCLNLDPTTLAYLSDSFEAVELGLGMYHVRLEAILFTALPMYLIMDGKG